MKVLHVITALNYGGAEAMLAKLIAAQGQRPRDPAPVILSLLAPGAVGHALAEDGAQMLTLDMRRGLPGPTHILRLREAVRAVDPDFIQGWMYHGNLAASLAAHMARRRVPVLWNIRHSLSDIRREKTTTQIVIRTGAWQSRQPRAIIYNSSAAERQHRAIGYDPQRARVIPNGFDLARFRPDDPGRPIRARLCAGLGIDPESILVGMVARLHPMKDHMTMIRAAGIARRLGLDIHLVLAGNGTDKMTPALMSAMTEELPADRISCLGDRRDLSDWLPGLDIIALSSAWGEGFPNILGEAMAAGLPCVATDVGDSGLILDSGGLCVPPGDAQALGRALAQLCLFGPEGRASMGRRGRARVEAEYGLPAIARRYAALYHHEEEGPRLRGETELEARQCAG